MRFDSFPPAVAVPPVVGQTPFKTNVIDVEPVVSSISATASSVARQDMRGGFASFSGSRTEQPLTYTNKGLNASTALHSSGRAIDLFV